MAKAGEAMATMTESIMAGGAPLQWRDLPWPRVMTRDWSRAPPALVMRMAASRHRRRRCRWRRAIARADHELAEHSGHHVEQEVAVERPAADLGHGHGDAHRAARWHDHDMLARPAIASAILQVHPEAMQMDGMVHHGLVLED